MRVVELLDPLGKPPLSQATHNASLVDKDQLISGLAVVDGTQWDIDLSVGLSVLRTVPIQPV